MAAYRRVDDLTVTCRLTACTRGSAPGPTLGIEYGKPLPLLAEDDHFNLTKQGASDSSWSLPVHWPTQWPWLLTQSFKRWSKSTEIATRFMTFRYEHLPDRLSRPSACAAFHHFIKLWRFSTTHQSQVVEHSTGVYVILRFNKYS